MKLKKYLYKKVESTNNVALRLIKQGNQRGIILTDQQTKGKGQRKNKWISIKGNLFLSVFFEISKKISLSKIINLNLKIIKKIIYKKINIFNKKCLKIIAITQGVKKFYTKKFNLKKNKM